MSLKDAQNAFKLVAKRILKKNLSTNPDTLSKYKIDICNAYNDFIEYSTGRIILLRPKDEYLKDIYIDTTKGIKNHLVNCLGRLRLHYPFSTKLFERIDLAKVTPIAADQYDITQFDDSYSDSSDTDTNTVNMAKPTAIEFMNAYSKIIPEFNGSIDKFQSALDALALVHTNVGDHTVTAVSMIKSKFTGKARTCILDTDDTVLKIIDRLKLSIKGETSESIIAKIHNVKQKDKSANKYVNEIEELTESLKTSYINEGVPPQLSEKYSTQQAVIAMKHNASNDKVKFVMEAGKFESLDEAVAKFVSTNNEALTNNSVMYVSQNRTYSKFNKRNYNNNSTQGYGFNRNSNNHRGGHFRGYNNRGNSNGNRYQNNYNNYNNFSRGNNRGYRRGNYNNNYQNREGVRFVEEQGNGANPQLLTLGEHASQRNQRN